MSYQPNPINDESLLAQYLNTELQKLANELQALKVDSVSFKPWSVEPDKPRTAQAYYADGTNWNPGHGKGLYTYDEISADWTPLFPTTTGIVTEKVHVVNTVTETTIYTTTIPAGQLSLNEIIRLTVSGYYDTAAASDTWTLRVKLGGTTIQTIARASANNAVDFGWELAVTATMRTIGATGTLIDSGILFDEGRSATSNDSTIHTVDTTIDNDLVVTVQWGLAKAGNDFHLDQGFLQAFH